MKSISKLFLFFGISGIGLFLCGLLFVNDEADSPAEDDHWYSVKEEPVENRQPVADANSESTSEASLASLGNDADLPEYAAGEFSIESHESQEQPPSFDLDFEQSHAASSTDWDAGDVAMPERSAMTDDTSMKRIQNLPEVEDEPMSITGQVVESSKVQNPFFNSEGEGQPGIETDSAAVQHSANLMAVNPEEGMPGESSAVAPSFEIANDADRAMTPQAFTRMAPNHQARPQVVQNPAVRQTQAGNQHSNRNVQMPRNHRMPAPIMVASPVVEERAQNHIQYGNSLARRGAIFAARQEFIQALRLIADSHDMQSGSMVYTRKLADALQALTESDDFVSVDSEQQLHMNVSTIIESHTARLIRPEHARDMSPIQAMQVYYNFAGSQMAQAVGQSKVASEALHSLGKLLTTAARYDANGKPMDQTKAMVMHQVALSANAGNHRSANELGVLLAGNGRWHQAADLFSESLKQKQTPTTWTNLARAHQQIAQRSNDPGERRTQTELASLAIQESQRLGYSHGQQMLAVTSEDWATAEQFNGSAAMPELTQRRVTGQQPAVPANVARQPETGKGILHKVKGWF